MDMRAIEDMGEVIDLTGEIPDERTVAMDFEETLDDGEPLQLYETIQVLTAMQGQLSALKSVVVAAAQGGTTHRTGGPDDEKKRRRCRREVTGILDGFSRMPRAKRRRT